MLEVAKYYYPIEVKWNTAPNSRDTKHLQKFLKEYSNTDHGYIICRTPRPYQVIKNIIAIPWQQLDQLECFK